MHNHKRAWTVAGLAVLLSAAVSGIAYAAIPDSGGVIHACYKTPVPAHGEALQIIDSEAGGSCASGFSPVTWNQVGPQGPVGPAGPQGPAGPGVTFYRAQSAPFTIQANDHGSGAVACNSGDMATGGGYELDGNDQTAFTVTVDAPEDGATADQDWLVQIQNTLDPSPVFLTVYAMCEHQGS